MQSNYDRILALLNVSTIFVFCFSRNYAQVICIPGSLGAGDSGDIAGPKCRDLTFDESRQCRKYAGVLISRQNPNLCHILQGGSSACTFAQSDQLLFRCLDENASWNRKFGCKTPDTGLLI